MRFARAAIALLALVTAAALLGSAPAAAHDDVGTIAIVSADETPSTTKPGAIELSVQARLTFESDGHPAEADATMTLVADAADGTSVGPVVAEPTQTPGVFAATLTLPSGGAWTLRASALRPFAALDVPLELAEQPEAAPAAPPWIPLALGAAVIAVTVVVLVRVRRRLALPKRENPRRP